VVRLSIVMARVLIAGCVPMAFLSRWHHIVAEPVGGFHTLVVEGIEDVVFGHGAEVG
jgi:hypothetical protein